MGRFAIGWGSFLLVPSLALLIVLDRGTAEFSVTVLTLCMGAFMVLAGAACVAFVKYHDEWSVGRKPRERRGRG